MDAYEKSVDKAVDAVEKIGRGANRLYIGCATIFANLFFAGFCLWGVYAGYISWKLENEGETITGRVVRLEESDSIRAPSQLIGRRVTNEVQPNLGNGEDHCSRRHPRPGGAPGAAGHDVRPAHDG